MTFSDKAVAAIVNEHFVAAWIDRAPSFHNEDYSTEKWIYEQHYEAYATKNICTFFLTPDGERVFHYVAGYFAPSTFARELETVVELHGAPDERRRLHDAAADAIDERKHDDAPAPLYRDMKHVHNKTCAAVARAGDRYLAALHRWWAKVDELPTFESIRFDYFYGNDFTEEPRKNRGIGGRCIGVQ